MAGVAVIVGVLIFRPRPSPVGELRVTKTLNASGFSGPTTSEPGVLVRVRGSAC